MPFLNGVTSRGHPQPSDPLSTASGSNGSHVHVSGDVGSGFGGTMNPTTPANSMANSDPIAVIGISLKFPQSATDVSSFWDLLVRGGSTRTEVPANRYNAEAFYHPKDNANKVGTVGPFSVVLNLILRRHSQKQSMVISSLSRLMLLTHPSSL